MKLKAGVKFPVLVPQMVLGATIVASVMIRYGVDAEVTSGAEPETIHKGKPVQGDDKDPHYMGKALDFSIHGFQSPQDLANCVDALGDALGSEYVVLWEMKGTPVEHIHVQFGHI